MAAGRLGRVRAGWRGLGLFWALVLSLAVIGVVVLQVLGPPSHSRTAASALEAPAPSPAPAEPTPARPAEARIPPPDPALLEVSKAFAPAMLPRVGADGRMARVVYARPFNRTDKAPRIAIVITGLGMSEGDSRTAIDTLPGPVTLAFSPYANDADPLLELARARGHETLVSIPMEPQGYPLNDAGSRSLLTGAEPGQNRLNLEWTLSRIQGYVGATGAIEGMRGERYAEQASTLGRVIDELGRRGLLYLDPRPGRTPGGNAPSRAVDLVIDDPPARAEIEAKLAALERLARDKGSAVGLAGPIRPVTVERIASWAKGLADKGITLAPLSALVEGTAAK